MRKRPFYCHEAFRWARRLLVMTNIAPTTRRTVGTIGSETAATAWRSMTKKNSTIEMEFRPHQRNLGSENGMTRGRTEILHEAMDLVGVIDAARRLGISHWTLRKHIARKTVTATRIGRRVLVPERELRKIEAEGLPSLDAGTRAKSV
jgi:excisionase family DNA binding protein